MQCRTWKKFAVEWWQLIARHTATTSRRFIFTVHMHAAIVNGNTLDISKKREQVWNDTVRMDLELDIVSSPMVISSKIFEEYKDAAGYYGNIFKEGKRLDGLDEIQIGNRRRESGSRREYVKTGLLDVKLSDYIGKAFTARQYSDYGDFVIVSREEAEEQYQHATEFVAAVKNYLEGVQ